MKQFTSTQPPPLTKQSFEFLLQEYIVLKDLYSQSELAAQGLFNFYLTIISAIIGAIILVLQTGTTSTVGIIAGLLIFSIIIGIFYQAGIINRYADQTRYAKAIRELRVYLVNHLPDTVAPLYVVPFRVKTTHAVPQSAIEIWEEKMWWLFPVGTHQLFIAFINSVCLSALLWLLPSIAQAISPSLLEISIASFLAFWCSIIAHDSYAKIKLRQEVAKSSKVSISEERSLDAQAAAQPAHPADRPSAASRPPACG